MKRLVGIALCLWLGLACPAIALEIPRAEGYVTDRANLISPATRQQLERSLRAFEDSDSTQIVVLTIPSLQGHPVELYALRVAESWGIGQQGRDNGALLLVSRDDRALRIEVGYGLESVLTDLLAGRIIDNEIAPHFQRGDFDGGIVAGVEAMIQAVRGEYQGRPRQDAERRRNPLGLLFILFFFGPALLRLFIPHSRSGRSRGIWFGGGGFGGGGFGGGGFGGGGGFSGGGGGFGGGGASGRW